MSTEHRARFAGPVRTHDPRTVYMLEAYGRATMEVLALLGAMSTLHELLRITVPLSSANRATLAKAHVDALKDELASLEEAYGLNLLLQGFKVPE